MTHRLTSDRAAVVSPTTHYQPIDAETPRGAKLILIAKPYGVAHIGILKGTDDFYSHWAPLPVFAKETT